MMRTPRTFRSGDRVIYTAVKHSTHPGPRAKDVRPERAGDGYLYSVDKFWLVARVRGTQLDLITRRGKTRTVDADDPRLHAAAWWERLLYKARFPDPRSPGPPDPLQT